MNNSETQFSIKAAKVEEVICVLRRIVGQLSFGPGVDHIVRRSRGVFGCSPKRGSIFHQSRLQLFKMDREDFEKNLFVFAFILRPLLCGDEKR